MLPMSHHDDFLWGFAMSGRGFRWMGPSVVTTGVAIVGAGLVVVTPVAPPVPDVQVHAIQLTSNGADSPLGDGTALVMGPSTIPIPTQGYLDLVDKLYLDPRGFGGTTQPLATPEGLYPVTGVKSLPFDTSASQGETILGNAIQGQHASATDPTVVFGWSQSATVSSLEMPQLQSAGVPSDDLHFVLVGDPNNPNGGLLERFNVPLPGVDHPTAPALGITFSGATPSDDYPTDIYTNEYDGFADFPQYPINFLSDLNAYLGILFQHTAYLSLNPDQLQPQGPDNPNGAILLPGSEDSTTDPCADCLTNYYMIPDQELPLLEVLQFIPYIGQPLYDLLEPDMRILVNLGYGDIDHGWSQGPADVPTTFGLFPDIDPTQLATALSNGWQQGVTDATAQLQNPDNYDLAKTFFDNTFLTQLVTLVHALGLTDATTPQQLLTSLPDLLQLGVNGLRDNLGFPTSDASLFTSSPTEIINDITGTISGDYATYLPIADTFNTLLTTLPTLLAGFLAENATHPLEGLGEAIAAGTALIPFSLIFGAAVPSVTGVLGTLVNLGELVGLGGDTAGSATADAAESAAGSLDLGGLLP
jgi:hypothetical protein